MSALQEWYRYVDSLVRPSRKFEELEEWWVPDDALAHHEAERGRSEEAPAPDEESRPPRPATTRAEHAGASPRAGRSPTPPPRPPQPAPSRHQPPARTSAPPVDPRAVVARLSGRVSEAPPSVEWNAVRGECKVPDLDEFIPHLGDVPSLGTATREFIEGVARFQVPPRRAAAPVPPAAPPRPLEPLPEAPSPAREDDHRVVEEIEPRDWLARSRPAGVTREPEASPPPSFEPEVAPEAILEDAAEPATPLKSVVPPPAVLPPEILTPEPADELLPLFPDVAPISERAGLPTISSIREGLPRTMERLLQIPTAEEVAQNSYKSPFRESREELIRRLFDPPLTLEDTARLLGVCPTTVRRYTNKGLLRHYRTQGNQRRFRLSDLLAFLERWGDAGPEAGALGGAASTRRTTMGTVRSSRKSAGATGESKDAEKVECASAPADAGGTDAGRV